MAKGGCNPANNGSRSSKPYIVPRNIVERVATRVSGYFGGWFNTSTETITETSTARTVESSAMSSCHTSDERLVNSVRIKLPTPNDHLSATSATSATNTYPTRHHAFESTSEPLPGPSGLQVKNYLDSTSTQHTTVDLKLNGGGGGGDDRSESGDSTSGCSSLVPQSDRLSQSYIGSSRKRPFEDKCIEGNQSRLSRSFLSSSDAPKLGESSLSRRKPSFDSSAYGSHIINKASVREKLITSPFYSGETSYCGSSYRRNLTRHTNKNCSLSDGRRAMKRVQVRTSCHESTEDLSNMSQTAKIILGAIEQLEQMSSPISNAKKIPVVQQPVLSSKRSRLDTSRSSTTEQSSGPPTRGLSVPTVPDLIKLRRLERIQESTAAARLVAATAPAAVAPVSVSSKKSESSGPPGKIVTKRKDREKGFQEETVESVALPNIVLPITTLPKFDLTPMSTASFNIPEVMTTHSPPVVSTRQKIVKPEPEPKPKAEPVKTPSSLFTFAAPTVALTDFKRTDLPLLQNFTFSNPISGDVTSVRSDHSVRSPILLTADAISKLKKRVTSVKTDDSSVGIKPSKELSKGSVMDILGNKDILSKNTFGDQLKPKAGWECGTCWVRNSVDRLTCEACSAPKVNNSNSGVIVEPKRTDNFFGFGNTAKTSNDAKTIKESPKSNSVSVHKMESTKPLSATKEPQGFGSQFTIKKNQWECDTCMIRNDSSAVKCVACETPKPSSLGGYNKAPSGSWANPTPTSAPSRDLCGAPHPKQQPGFGNLFTKKNDQWECPVCMIRNDNSVVKCVACETSKPGAGAVPETTKKDPPKFYFGLPPGGCGFKFGIDNANATVADKTASSGTGFAVAKSESTASVPFSFGIPPNQVEKSVGGSPPKTTVNGTLDTSTTFLFSNTNTQIPLLANTFSDKPETESTSNNHKSTSAFSFINKPTNPEPLVSKQSPGFSFVSKEVRSTKLENNALKASESLLFETSPSSLQGSKVETKITAVATKDAEFIKQVTTVADTKPTFSFGQPSSAPTAPSAPSQAFQFAAQVPSGPQVSSNSTFGTTSTPFSHAKALFGVASSTTPVTFGESGTSSSFVSSSGFGTQPTVNSTPTLGATTTPAFGTTSGFGGPTSLKSASPFGNTTTPQFGNIMNSAAKSPFAFGSAALPATSAFGHNTQPVQGFGTDFSQKAADKPVAAFGTPATITSQSPGPFSFSAKPTPSEPQATFGSGFGPPTNNAFVFGATQQQQEPFNTFNTPKAEVPTFGAQAQPTHTAPSFGAVFGAAQSSAPPAFGSTNTGFNFGAPAMSPFPATQPQPQPQPQSAPAFNLNVPSKFNFTGGKSTTFSADPLPPAHSHRKVIKAVRRTHR